MQAIRPRWKQTHATSIADPPDSAHAWRWPGADGVNDAAPHVSQRRWVADLCLLATALIWGVNILVFKYSIGILEPVVFNASRLVFSTIALALCVWLESRWSRRPVLPRSTPDQPINWIRVAWFSVLTGLCYMVLFLTGIMRTTAGNTALLLASTPMWTAVLSYFGLHERLPRITWLGLGLTMLGTILVTMAGGQISMGMEYYLGNLLILGAGLSWASATVISHSILRTMSPLQLTFIASLVTTPLHVAWVLPQLHRHWSTIGDPWMLTAIVFSGAFSTGLAYAFWNTGVKILGGSHAAIYQNVVTLVAVTGGWLVLAEQPLAGQIIGGITIIIGVLVMRRGRRRPAASRQNQPVEDVNVRNDRRSVR